MAYEPPADLPVAAPKSQSLIVEPSALASIPTPPITDKPDIPDSIPQKGILQAHQYQTVCQAVNAHNTTLPDGRRRGYFCGDGTGAGKTRIIAGVMLDAVNRNLGKGKALIISKNKELYEGALGDFEPFGINGRLFDLTDAKWKSKLEKNGRGIAFVTYPSLAQNYAGTDAEGNVRSAGKRGKSLNRYEEIVKWLGKDFDGVIAFDEAHSAAKDDGMSGLQAKRSQAVIDLQNALPNARVLYLTATAAYDAEDLRFLTRMGLWGEGAGFDSFGDFADAVNRGGLSMMEILTQGMKANGGYCSRSISFKGVNCKRVVAKVTPEQKQTYSDYSSVLSQIHDAAMSLTQITGAPTRFLSAQYFGRTLDLFNSLMTALKIDKAIELGRQAIADGKSPVFQLISTNESARDRKAALVPKKKIYDLFGNVVGEEVAPEEETEVGVKDRIIAYLQGGGFPVREYLGKDPGGPMQWGEEVPEAVELRDEMIALVNSLPDVANPIDALTKAFADVGISRITGKSNKNAEAAAFNDGKNLALVFSGAGGTGASYHADKRFKNQRQRVQIPIEFGWEPDKFLQALGRSHRNNQVVPPEFVLLTTDIAGEMRFMSTIANRVAAMGAIVGGDRNSSGQVVSSNDSADTIYGRAAIRDVIHRLGSGQRIGEMPADEALRAMFLSPDKLDEVEPTRFLGRLQLLPVDEQNAIYSEIAANVERSVAAAKADGTYDDGIRKIDAKRVNVVKRESMSTGENEGQNRDLLTVSEWYDSRRITHEQLEARAPEGKRVEYVRNKKSGKLYGLIDNGERIARLAPNGGYESIMPLERGNYETVADREAARKAWDDEYAKLPAEEERVNHYMSGDLIPVWDKIGVEGRPFVYRATPTEGRPFIGLYIGDAQLPITLYGFGKKEEARRFFKENGYRLVTREGAKFGIGAKGEYGMQPYFKRAKIGSRYVLAVYGALDGALVQDLKNGGWDSMWGRDESNYEDRGGTIYFRDFDDAAAAAFGDLVKNHGVVVYRGRKVAFSTKDGLADTTADERRPMRGETSPRRGEGRAERPQRGGITAPDAGAATLAERVGMPQMRMRVQNGELIITNTDSRRKDDLKLAFGGEWANRARDGKRYVNSDLRWNREPSGRGGWWSIPLDKVPANIRAEVEGSGILRAPVAPLGSVEEMNREGGLVRLAQNPDEFKATFVYNLLRSPVVELDGGKYAMEHESNLIRRAADDGDMAALGELYNRYMGPKAKNGGLVGLIRRAVQRKGMAGVMDEGRIEEVASLVWAGVKVEEQYKGDPNATHYEYSRNGIITDFNNGDTAIYKDAKSLIPVMTTKIDRILKSMAERAANRPEMLTLDRPSAVREGESELDQQIADEPSAAEGLLAGDAANEYVEDADDTAESIIAAKLGDVVSMGSGRRLSREERQRADAMDMLDETMFFLPEDLQDVITAVLAEERKRGFTEKGASRISNESYAAAQKASGLSPRVFGYRYRTAMSTLNEIWNNIRSGRADANIAIKAREFDGAVETDEELNEDILDNLDISMDTRRVLQLLLDGEAVQDIADAFKLPPALVRAWKARARTEYGLEFPADPNENSLGLDLGEPTKRERKPRGPRKDRNAKVKVWTPDMFAASNATVNDVQNEKIETGILAGATDEQIAEDAKVDPAIVKLARVRLAPDGEGRVVAPKSLVQTSGMRTTYDLNPDTGHLEERREWMNTDGTTKPVQDTLFAPVEPLEQGTLGVGFVEPPYGYTNAAANEWRSANGFSEIAKKAKVSLDALHRQGAAMANNTAEMQRMVERLEKSPYAVSPVEQVALGSYIVKMQNDYNTLVAQKREAAENGNEALAVSLDIDAEDLFAKLDAAQRVNNRVVGNQLGLAMRARQLTIDKDGNLADYMVSLVRAKGKSLSKDEREAAHRLFGELEKANVKLDEATMADMVSYLDGLSRMRLAAQNDALKERKANVSQEKIERDYAEALAQIRYHGEKRSGGVLHGLPNGQKWIRALEAYHLLNGEALKDGKPDAAKMVDLLVKDINGVGVEATAWDVRQMESRMGNLTRPSQDEISKSLRDLHAQMLVTQQMEHMLTTGEMPPKTGFDRDEESAAVRGLRRERDRLMRNLGISRKTADELIKTALDAYKTRLRNKIEENEKAIADIEAGKPYQKPERRKLELDDEALSLKERNEELKKRLDELTRDPAKEQDRRVMRAMDALARTIALRKEQIAAIEAGTFDFDAKRPKLEDERLTPLRDELKALNAQKDALKKALFPYGTDAEVERRMKQRVEAAQKSLDRWNAMAADYEAETSWEGRAKAVAPSERRKIPESDELKEKRKLRDAARAKVVAYRQQLEREDTRGEATRQWMRLLTSAPVLLRTMMDMSVGMVQGGRYMLAHPIKWTKTATKATKAFLTQKWADKLAEEIRSDPYFEDFKAHGGHLYNMEGLNADVPEDFRALEVGAPLPGGKTFSITKMPGIKRSARSFAGFLNRAGLELYRDMVEAAGRDGVGATDNVKKDIARFVNTALGYGYDKQHNEKGLMRSIMLVADALAWAPRKALAEIKYATGYDMLVEPWLGTRRHEKSGAEIRQSMKAIGREKGRYLLGALAYGTALLLLAKLVNGDDDEDQNRLSDILDPRSADFGRVRIGNTSFSFLAGSEMVWRLIGRLVAGQSKVNGIVIDKSREDVVKQYVRGKANPLLGLAWDLAVGKDYLGNEVKEKSVGKLIRDYAMPLTWASEYDNFSMNDPIAAIINALPVFFGGAKSTYERDPLDRVVAQGDEAKRRTKAAAETGDAATAERTMSALGERGETYSAAKVAKNAEKKLKELQQKEKELNAAINRAGGSAPDGLVKQHEAVLDGIEKLKAELPDLRERALKTYRANRGTQNWDEMDWTER